MKNRGQNCAEINTRHAGRVKGQMFLPGRETSLETVEVHVHQPGGDGGDAEPGEECEESEH